jgi:adenosylmethionine-8-amino-7-oxononanoate aminotransferase
MTGIEVAPRQERTGFEVCRRARENGVLVRPLGDVVVLMPPLAISEAELTALLDITAESIAAALASLPSEQPAA